MARLCRNVSCVFGRHRTRCGSSTWALLWVAGSCDLPHAWTWVHRATHPYRRLPFCRLRSSSRGILRVVCKSGGYCGLYRSAGISEPGAVETINDVITNSRNLAPTGSSPISHQLNLPECRRYRVLKSRCSIRPHQASLRRTRDLVTVPRPGTCRLARIARIPRHLGNLQPLATRPLSALFTADPDFAKSGKHELCAQLQRDGFRYQCGALQSNRPRTAILTPNMSTSKEMVDTPEQRASDDVKTSKAPTVKSDVTSEEPKGGMGGYVVCIEQIRRNTMLTTYQRIFKYADRTSWILNTIAFVAAIAAGTLLPLM